jgi:WD40 repeat protein
MAGDGRALESIALSPDGKVAAAGSVDTSLSLWDLASGKLVRRWKQQDGVAITRVAFSPDGKTLAANGSTDVYLWKVPSCQRVGQINGMGEHIRCLRFNPDGKSVAASDINGGIVLADVAGLRAERKFSPPEGRAFNDEIWSLAFAPDGKILVSGGWRRKVILWDVASGRALRQFQDHNKYVRSVAVSSDGRMVAAGGDEDTVVVREIATGRVMHTLNSPGCARALAFAPDCRTLIGGNYHNEVYLWDLATTEGDRFATLAGHFGGWVTELACAPGGEFVAAASSDSTALLWDLPAAYEQRTEQVVRATGPAELKKAWDMLSDASTADRGLWRLVESAPESISFLAGQLKPAKAGTDVLAEVPKLIADLDAGQFKVRERAAERLWEIGPPARPLLEEALRGKLSFEQRSRIRRMLRDFAAPPDALLDSPEALAKVRAVYVLEHIGSEPARDLLQKIAESPKNTAERHNAKSALERLAAREVK